MDTSLYFPPYTHTQNTSSDELNTTHNKGSLLLNTEPRDLDKLFHRTSFQQKPEEDICFPPNNRPSVSSNESTLDDRHKNKTIPKNNNGNSSFEDINLNALYELMQKRKEQPYSPAQRHLLSLYGDNTLTCNHQQKYSQYPPQTTKDENRFMYYHPDTGSLLGPTLQEISLPPQMTLEGLLLKENYWIDVTAPTNEEMIMLSKMFHIHPLTTEDIMSYEIREKCDVFRHYMFVCYRAFLHDIQQLKPVTFYNIVTKKHTLTFHFEQVPHVGNVQQRVKQLQDYIEIVPDWINYALIDEITDSFAPIIQQIESEVDAIDDSVLLYKVDQTDVVLRIGTCRKKVIQMVRLLGTKVEVVRGLMKRILENRHACQDVVFDELTDGKIYPDVELYLGDVQDHILTMVQNLNHYETVLARSESNYLARISIQLTETSNSTNHVIGRLTIFATVMLPMNLITGLWGMNVKVPGKDYDNLVYFFWIVISLVVFAIFSLTLAKRLKFI
ncbi:uncharacterized protein B0P05DRAFT_512534 [Gilbertella persicaria]|uniref:uncharacterized protein n=1 Tax=Gilbertella persicaria TaxID=101096 RepID=UPI002220A6D2|nr:uncharacterized protein B0P05DRAFT_512534 [Gilbertella persicaria]KAI8075393.1 hypothetical protein B0P05DRAFT_512534 [Gilbertella persicaria]